MRRILREPLLHFFLLGTLLFVGYRWLHPASSASSEIVVSRGQVESLPTNFTRTWRRAPTDEELQGLIETWVREEILYREGIALGFDRDDPVVRRRIAQKVEFLTDEQAPSAPTSSELQTWLDEHSANYRVEARYSLRQIYIDPTRRGAKLEADIEAARAALARGEPVEGDPTMLPQGLESASGSEVAHVFGKAFVDALTSLPVGGWQGPVQSGFGLHLVEVRVREDARLAKLEEVRAEVERDLLYQRAVDAKATFYDKLRANYTVRIETGEALAATETGRPAK
jgi:PPIC-type PPIASE domain